MAPWLPRYVTTGCLVSFGVGFAETMPAISRTLVKREVMETMLMCHAEAELEVLSV
jgi:hypothetical protein